MNLTVDTAQIIRELVARDLTSLLGDQFERLHVLVEQTQSLGLRVAASCSVIGEHHERTATRTLRRSSLDRVVSWAPFHSKIVRSLRDDLVRWAAAAPAPAIPDWHADVLSETEPPSAWDLLPLSELTATGKLERLLGPDVFADEPTGGEHAAALLSAEAERAVLDKATADVGNEP